MKIESLKRRTFVKGITSAVIILAFVGVFLAVQMMAATKTTELSRLKADLRGLNTSIQQLDKRYVDLESYHALYQQLNHDENAVQGIDRRAIASTLSDNKEEYFIEELRMKMTPVIVMQGAVYQKDSFDVEHTQVTLTFSCVSDEYCFNFLNATLADIPGKTKIQQLKLIRQLPMDNQFYSQISQERFPEAVTATAIFHWLAIRAKPSPSGGR